jgi:hypothetical protein
MSRTATPVPTIRLPRGCQDVVTAAVREQPPRRARSGCVAFVCRRLDSRLSQIPGRQRIPTGVPRRGARAGWSETLPYLGISRCVAPALARRFAPLYACCSEYASLAFSPDASRQHARPSCTSRLSTRAPRDNGRRRRKCPPHASALRASLPRCQRSIGQFLTCSRRRRYSERR